MRAVKRDGHILIKGTDSESACVKVEGSERDAHPQVPDNQPKFEIPDAFKVKFKHYFDDVYGAQASIYKALGYCLIFEGKPFFKCRVDTAKEAVLQRIRRA